MGGLHDRAVSLDDLKVISKDGDIEGLTKELVETNSTQMSYAIENL